VLEYDTNQKYLKFFENVSALYKILKEDIKREVAKKLFKNWDNINAESTFQI
jgi:hypothetical protein